VVGKIVTLDNIQGMITMAWQWRDGVKFFRLRDKDGKLSDHFVAPGEVIGYK